MGDKEEVTHKKLQTTDFIRHYYILKWAFFVHLQAADFMN